MKKILALIIIMVFCDSLTQAQLRQKSSPKEQTAFAMETDIQKPVKIPNYVLQQILRNEDSESQDLAERVQASLINLNNDGKSDLLVQGDDGANITGFWVFHNINSKWQLVFSTRAFGLSINKTYTNGYRDISASAMTASTVFGSTYSYNLKQYKPKECWEQDVKWNEKTKKFWKSKIRYFNCES